MSTIDLSHYYWKNDFIQIRYLREDDYDAVLPNLYDSLSRYYFNDLIEMPVDPEKRRKWFLDSTDEAKAGYIPLAIENSEGSHVGILNLFSINERAGTFGPVGIQINPDFRHMGYGFAAFRMLGDYLFYERRMHKWNSGYVEANKPSAALHRKIGFVVEGVQRDMVYHEGKYFNTVFCGMLEEEYRASKERE